MKYKLPDKVTEVMDKIRNEGYEIYAVGGCVRNMILKIKTKDWDFTTNATPLQIVKIFPNSFYDNKFGTVGIPIKEKVKGKDQTAVFEITTFRSESGYSDNRHPDNIKWGNRLEEDLKRRDFTINAIAFDGKNLIDPYKGQIDLANKLIKAVGDPNERFKEDALRMMRAVRIASQLNFLIDEKTYKAISINSILLQKVSGERIRDELVKILSANYPADGIRMLKNFSILSIILPELEKCFGIEQKSPKRHHKYDVGTHLLLSLEKCPCDNPIVRFATLLHDVGKAVTYKKTAEGVITFYNHEIFSASIVKNIANRLRFAKHDRDKLLCLVRYHQFTVNENQTDSALRRFIKNVGPENLQDILSLRTGDRLGGGARESSWRLELYKKRLIEVQKQPFRVQDLKVSGHDVMEIYGIGPGPYVGSVLNMLFSDVIEGKLKNVHKMLIQRIKDLKKESKSLWPKSPELH